jgi:Raf kinase inhibitor-like YbhB/YbcL family protein
MMVAACQPKSPTGAEASMDVIIAAFPREGSIPKTFTADGADVSPAMSWMSAPAGTKGFAVIMDDPDAPVGLWTHWTLYNLPATTTSLGENLPKAPTLPDGSHQGKNTWGRLGYNGPSPPPGKPHRYYFRVYALSQLLDLPAGATREELDRAIKGKVLAEGSYMAKYGR